MQRLVSYSPGVGVRADRHVGVEGEHGESRRSLQVQQALEQVEALRRRWKAMEGDGRREQAMEGVSRYKR